MNKLFFSIIAVFVALGAVLLFQASRTGTSLVLLPSELLAETGNRSLSRIRVAGRVTSRPIEYRAIEPFELKFTIANPSPKKGEEAPADSPATLVPVVYSGLKPDMFAPGRDVIIDGSYKDGVLRASKLMTQCPSKYEPPTAVDAQTGRPAHPAAGSSAAAPSAGQPAAPGLPSRNHPPLPNLPRS